MRGAHEFFRPTASSLPDEYFEAVHTREHYRGFVSLAHDAARMRRVGFAGDDTYTHALVERTRLEAAGTVLTAELALRHGLAANLAGGTHHAHADFGSGFCILNDLAVTAAAALRGDLERGHGGGSAARGGGGGAPAASVRVRRVAIVDLDVHQGDGTATLFADEPRVHTCSVHCADNFPFRKAHSAMCCAM